MGNALMNSTNFERSSSSGVSRLRTQRNCKTLVGADQNDRTSVRRRFDGDGIERGQLFAGKANGQLLH